jgi:hypothetical protein
MHQEMPLNRPYAKRTKNTETPSSQAVNQTLCKHNRHLNEKAENEKTKLIKIEISLLHP